MEKFLLLSKTKIVCPAYSSRSKATMTLFEQRFRSACRREGLYRLSAPWRLVQPELLVPFHRKWDALSSPNHCYPVLCSLKCFPTRVLAHFHRRKWCAPPVPNHCYPVDMTLAFSRIGIPDWTLWSRMDNLYVQETNQQERNTVNVCRNRQELMETLISKQV